MPTTKLRSSIETTTKSSIEPAGGESTKEGIESSRGSTSSVHVTEKGSVEPGTETGEGETQPTTKAINTTVCSFIHLNLCVVFQTTIPLFNVS